MGQFGSLTHNWTSKKLILNKKDEKDKMQHTTIEDQILKNLTVFGGCTWCIGGDVS